jgi:peptide/nickel transport system permease protein
MGTIIGMGIGVASAYFGGKFDLMVQRFVDTMMGFPGLVLVLIMVVALGPSLFNVTLAIAITYSDKVIRLSRSAALSVKEEDYILAARAVGVDTRRILYRHVAPNTLAPIFVLASAQLGASIVTEAGLSFLGLGVQPPTPSWGNMLQAAATGNMEAAPWLAIYPGLALAIVTFAFAVFGDALRDVLDPRLRGT